ncbi:hypothetical protein MMC14_004706 [Varicellaria rhodocarpa]|nr:hypothetical protein [Varicellaria rhodocarpa]
MEWPYAASGSASRIAPYGSGSSHYAPNSAAQPPPAAFPGLTAVPSNRLEQGVPYNMEFDPFGYSQSQYLSQGQEATNPYGAQEVSRPWASTGVSSRWVTNGSFEQEMPSRCNSQTYPYASPPSSSGSTLDGSLFPGLSQLANALPAPNFSIDRVLPNPLAGNGTQYSDNNLGASDSNPYLPSHPSNARTAVSWPHERLGAGNVPAAASTSANSLTSMVGGKTSSTSEPQEHTFGYIPVSHSPSSDNGPIASDFSAQNSNSSMISLADQLCSKSSYGPESSSDSLLRSSNSSNNLYTYSSSSNAKRGSQSLFSSGTLTNGEPYTPHVRQTPHHTLTYLMQRHEPMDQHSRASHQTPIASVGSSRR